MYRVRHATGPVQEREIQPSPFSPYSSISRIVKTHFPFRHKELINQPKLKLNFSIKNVFNIGKKMTNHKN
jgi:hypothetical protein